MGAIAGGKNVKKWSGNDNPLNQAVNDNLGFNPYKTLNPNTGSMWHMPGWMTTEVRAPGTRDRKEKAEQQSQTNAQLMRQKAMAMGIGGGGAQAGAEAQGAAAPWENFAAQQEQARQAAMQRDMQTLFILFKLFGGG